MGLKDIKPVATPKTIRDEHGVHVFREPTAVYTAEQMQEYGKVERDYILVIDGGFGTKIYAKNRFTGVAAVDIYGDQYKVLNHVSRGKKWVLQEAQDV